MPIYYFDYSLTDYGDNWYYVNLYIEGADDGVHPDFVGIEKITRNYTFWIQLDDGYIVNGSGEWAGDSIQNHPDFAWYPGSQPEPRISALNYSTIQTIANSSGGTNDPAPRILANGYSGSITADYYDPVSITISLDPGSLQDQKADWWVGVVWEPENWASYVYDSGWLEGIHPMIQYPLFGFSGYEVFNYYGLPAGTYLFYFGVDNNADGQPNVTWYDYVGVIATENE